MENKRRFSYLMRSFPYPLFFIVAPMSILDSASMYIAVSPNPITWIIGITGSDRPGQMTIGTGLKPVPINSLYRDV